MELIDLFRQQEKISCDILIERFHGITFPELEREIKEYKTLTMDFAAALRRNNQLTHKGRQVKTKPDLKKICIEEGWTELFIDMEVNNNA